MKDHARDTVGHLPPELELDTDRGERFSLAALRGRPVLVSFLSHAA